MFDSTRDCHTCILKEPLHCHDNTPLQDKREEKQIEIANRIREALHCGLKVLEDAFVQLELEHTGGNWGRRGGEERRREGRREEEIVEEEQREARTCGRCVYMYMYEEREKRRGDIR